MTDFSEEYWLAIDDPRVPDWVRQHARKFRKPCTHVLTDDFEGFLLFAEVGKWLDGIVLQEKR